MKYRDLEDRLIANSIVDPATGCWNWIGNQSYNGYGRMTLRVNGKHRKVGAHRVSVQVLKGYTEIPPGIEVDHLCFNRLCINPDHLRLVPKAENWNRWKKLEKAIERQQAESPRT